MLRMIIEDVVAFRVFVQEPGGGIREELIVKLRTPEEGTGRNEPESNVASWLLRITVTRLS